MTLLFLKNIYNHIVTQIGNSQLYSQAIKYNQSKCGAEKMNNLIIGLVIFLGAHLFLRTKLTQNIKEKIGAMPFKGIFSIISLVGFVLIIIGYGQYRPIAPELYLAPKWGKHLNYLLTLVSMIMLVSGYLKGKIAAIIKHPQLNAIKFWAFGHLIANGDLASFILFASFLGWAIISRILQPKSERQNVPWGRNDEASIAFGILLWITIGYKLHPILFGVNPFGG